MMPASVLYLLAGILLTIFVVVGIHEAGHFFMARLLNIRVTRFSLGFGRPLLSLRDRRNTEFVIAAIPLGGYVSLLEERDATSAEKPWVFTRQPLWKRFLVIAAGPATNLLFALCLYWIIFTVGFVSILPVTGNITPHSIAAEAGLQKNLRITHVDNRSVHGWMGVVIRVLNHAGEHDTLTVTAEPVHGHKARTYTLDLAHWKLDPLKPDLFGSLGITPWLPKTFHTAAKESLPQWILYENKYPPLQAFAHAWQNTSDFTLLNLRMAGRMLTGQLSLKNLGGPISIFGEAGAALQNGIISFMSFLAFLSIAVGIINIFPIPGLDGGHLLFQVVEAILRRPIPERFMALFYRLGLLFIILISLQAVLNDLMRLGK